MTRLGIALVVLALACKDPPPPPPPPPDPLEVLPLRRPAVIARLPRGAATRVTAIADTVVLGSAGAFHGIDARSGAKRWRFPAGARLFRPVTDGTRLYLPWVARGDGIVAQVDPATGALRQRTVVRVTDLDRPLRVELNTPPAVGGGLVVWPSSRFLFAFELGSGRRRWTYEATGPTPYRRFHFGSHPPLLGEKTAYWGHQQGVAAVSLDTGRARWTWRAYRGFALRPLLAADTVFASNDAGLAALDRKTGAQRWLFAPAGLRFEHLADEDLSGLFRGHLWFVAEPEPYRFHLFFVNARTGTRTADVELYGGRFTGSVASDGSRLYARIGPHLVAYDLATGKPLWRAAVPEPSEASSPAVAEGRVWVTGGDGTLVGLEASP